MADAKGYIKCLMQYPPGRSGTHPDQQVIAVRLPGQPTLGTVEVCRFNLVFDRKLLQLRPPWTHGGGTRRLTGIAYLKISLVQHLSEGVLQASIPTTIAPIRAPVHKADIIWHEREVNRLLAGFTK